MIDNYVTGSSGFIGRHLLRRLSGHTVTIPHRKIGEVELTDFHQFYFLSTYGNMAHHENNAAKIMRANLTDLAHILYLVRDGGLHCNCFVHMSSSSVNLPVQTPYSRTKRAAEEMVMGVPGLPSCVIRPYTVVGVGEQPEHLIPRLIRSCMEGVPMNLVLDAAHDYVDVQDVVNGMVNLATNRATGVFEFGSGISTTNVEVLELVQDACGKAANVLYVDSLRPYDTPDWCCRDFRAIEMGWQRTKSLQQSIREMVVAYQNEHS